MSDATSRPKGVLARIASAMKDRRGVGAIEFALVAPMLILLYIGAAEISVAMSVNKKVARASSTVADLVTRNDDVDKAYLDTMVDVANAVMTPYNESPIKLKITEISIDSSNHASIRWSWDQDGNAPYTSGDAVTVPADLKKKDTDLIRTEMSFDHSLYMPGAKSMDISTLTMRKTYYLRPRGNGTITCSDCPG